MIKETMTLQLHIVNRNVSVNSGEALNRDREGCDVTYQS